MTLIIESEMVVTEYRIGETNKLEEYPYTTPVELELTLSHDGLYYIFGQARTFRQFQVVEGFLDYICENGMTLDMGSAPVQLNGNWGGRNYPNMWVSPEKCKEVVESLDIYRLVRELKQEILNVN